MANHLGVPEDASPWAAKLLATLLQHRAELARVDVRHGEVLMILQGAIVTSRSITATPGLSMTSLQVHYVINAASSVTNLFWPSAI